MTHGTISCFLYFLIGVHHIPFAPPIGRPPPPPKPPLGPLGGGAGGPAAEGQGGRPAVQGPRGDELPGPGGRRPPSVSPWQPHGRIDPAVPLTHPRILGLRIFSIASQRESSSKTISLPNSQTGKKATQTLLNNTTDPHNRTYKLWPAWRPDHRVFHSRLRGAPPGSCSTRRWIRPTAPPGHWDDGTKTALVSWAFLV